MCNSIFFELYMYNSIFLGLYMYNSVFFELYIYNSIFFELYMYNSVFFVRYIPIYISIHSTFSLFLNLPLGKRLHFSPFHGWVLKCIFFQAALVWNQNCNFGKPAGSLLAVLVLLPAALVAHLELLSIIDRAGHHFWPDPPYSSLASRFCKTKS